jgi:16S rRNA (cytosine1402-N4)-methyltransferase
MKPPLHEPVMRDRVVALLSPALQEPGAVLVDATLGLGGHSTSLLRTCPQARLIGIDRDQEALDVAAGRLTEFADRITLVHAVFDEAPDVLSRQGLSQVQGVLLDLGVSSMQLDVRDRGFAYSYAAPLDMRMDRQSALTASDVVNDYSVADLTRVLREYGEERFAARIARTIAERRPLHTSSELVDAIRDAIPAPAQREGGHPAKRTFQALRVEVNDELGALRRALPQLVDVLAVRGRIVVMSYQSLEDRFVKRVLTARMQDDVPPDLPVPGRGPELRMLTRGAERPTADEIEQNGRATAARVRAAERVRAA